MLRETRHETLLRILRDRGVLPIDEIAARLEVSEATARRDLNDLGRQGRLTRVYGGAVSRDGAEHPLAEVAVDDPAGKDALAHRAARLVEDGETVLLDIGTTTLRLARLLRGRKITVVTGNLAVYEELREDAEVALVLLGGRVRRNHRSMGGHLTQTALGQLYADRLFLSASGILPDGTVLDATDVEVPVKRAMLGAAREAVLLGTAGKFPGTGTARVCGPAALDVLVTHRGGGGQECGAAALAAFREAGVEVIEV